jgi:hypothetical protein
VEILVRARAYKETFDFKEWTDPYTGVKKQIANIMKDFFGVGPTGNTPEDVVREMVVNGSLGHQYPVEKILEYPISRVRDLAGLSKVMKRFPSCFYNRMWRAALMRAMYS